MKRLKRTTPFKADQPRLKFPNIFYYEQRHDKPTWMQLETIKENEGYGKYRGLYENRLDQQMQFFFIFRTVNFDKV